MNSGIYKIERIATGQMYVGSAVTLRTRLNDHRCELNRKTHKNQRLQHAWTKDGEAGFTFSILEYVEDKALLITREQYWINLLNAACRTIGFNISPTAGSPLGCTHGPEFREKIRAAMLGRIMTLEHRARIGAAHKGKTIAAWHKERIGAAQRGRHHTKEHVAKLVATRIGRRHSPETKAKMSAWQKGRKKQISPDGRARIAAAAILAHTGRVKSPEEIAKLRAALRGRSKSPEHRTNIRATLLGRAPSLETQAKIAATKLAKHRPKTYKFSEEARQNIAEAQARRFKATPMMRDNKGRIISSHLPTQPA